jgi:hypothetical protein
MMENAASRHIPVGTVLHLNGASSAYFYRRVSAFLDRKFVTFPWLSRSPDLTPLDFFCGFMKDVFIL